MYQLDFTVVIERFPELLVGAAATLGLATAGILLALVIGVLGAAMRQSRYLLSRVVVRAFVELIRNTPFLVQIFFLFFALPFAGVRLSPTTTAIIALAINGGAYSIEIIRGGIESIHRGQTEAGLALGLSRIDVFRFVVLRPALRAIYPALTSQFILLTLTSSVCASIAAFELTSVAQKVEADTFRSFEVYFTITGIYLALSWMMMTLFGVIGRRAFSYPTA
jgi:polar amino acid transport system permease protein